MIKKVIYRNRIIAEIYFYLNYKKHGNKRLTPKGFAKYLTRHISATSTGYAGFQRKKYLEASLSFNIFNSKSKLKTSNITSTHFPIKEILSHIEKTMKEVYRFLPSKIKTRIYIFPTFRSFVKDKMFGVNGITPYRNTINIYIHPEPQNQKMFFQEIDHTVAHEYNHTIRFQYSPLSSISTLLDGLINEGLAENFRMRAMGGKISPWADVLQPEKVRKVFKKIRPFLHSTGKKIYYEVFFADKKYPLWTGYSIGYQIVKGFLKNNKTMKWEEIVKLKAKDILQESNFSK